MVTPIDPTSAAFLYAESRTQPMHVGGLQLFERPEGAGRDYARQMYAQLSATEEIAPLFLKRPHRSLRHGRPAGLGARRALRHRAPRAAQRPAPAGPRPRAARPLLAAAQPAPGLGAAAVGGARHRGPARRPGRDVHQDPPRARRRRLGDAAAGQRAVHRPRPSATCRRRGRPGPPTPRRSAPARRPSRRWPTCRSRRCDGARPHRRGGRDAVGAGQDAHPRPAQRDLRRCPSTPRGRCSTSRSPGRGASPPRTGRSSGCGRSAGRPAPPSTTSCWPCAAARCGPTCSTTTRCRTPAWWRWCRRPQRQAVPGRLRRRRQRGRLGDGAAGHRPRRPGRPPGRHPPLDARRQGGAVVDDADADPGHERDRDGALDPHPDAADAGHRPAAVQRHHQQRARAAHRRSTSTAPGWSAPTRSPSPSTGWRSTSPARRTTARWASASPAAGARSRTCSGCWGTSTTSSRRWRRRRELAEAAAQPGVDGRAAGPG